MRRFVGFVSRAAAAGLAWGLACALAADAPDPERLAEAKALLGEMQVERQFDSMAAVMADGMAKQFAAGRSAGGQRVAQVTMDESLRAMKEQILAPGGLMDSMAQAYASQFSLAELRQIHAFYASPAGRHILQASPELMKQVLPKIMDSARASMPRVCARAKERLLAEKVEGADAMKCPTAP